MSPGDTAPPGVLTATQRLASWFDLESAAVVTILLGLFQLMLAVPLVYAGPIDMPRFFILPLLIGILIIAGGSLAMANERTPNRYLLQGSACSNVLSLLGAVIAFCLYCVSFSRIPEEQEDCHFSYRTEACTLNFLMKHCSSILVLLLIYDVGAIVLHCILSTASLRGLKNG